MASPDLDAAATRAGAAGDDQGLLTAAVQEAARLLDADGAMVYLVDPATGHLRFAHDAGIRSERSRKWVRNIDLPPGTGMFGRAVDTRSIVVTDDYPNDVSFQHASGPDRVVADIGIRSMVVAPMVAGDEVFGALGTFSTRQAAFTPAQIALVRSLADHAAAAMANARLIEALDRSRTELSERAEIERALREINARISAASDLSGVLQRGVDEAARLLRADGARIDLIDADTGRLRWAYAAAALKPDDDPAVGEIDHGLHEGIAGQVFATGRPFWTGDYLHDDRFGHTAVTDDYIKASGIRSVMSGALVGEAGPFGTLTVFTARPDAWGDADAGVLDAIAAQAAITITTTRLIDELDRSREKLTRQAEAEKALREIGARIIAMRDPAEILQEVIELASRLVRGQGAILDLLEPGTDKLRWAFDDGLRQRFSDDERAMLWISIGDGATGTAVAEDRVIIAGDDLASLFPPSSESTEFYARTGFRSMIAAPVTGEDGPLGVIEVYAIARDAFDATDGDLIRALAGQAAIAITNARLITELASSRAELGRTADAERTLREIAATVSAMHDEDQILQAVADAATRLLGASGAMIDLTAMPQLTGVWSDKGPDARIQSDRRLLDEIELEPGAGVSGLAIDTRQIASTGDYLTDDRFMHTPERDDFVRRANIHSVISAPMLQRGGVLGAITVYGDRIDAFDQADAAVLGGLADQASIAIANVHLIAELERSREEMARRADAEQTLREIAARVTAILDPAEVLQRITDEATRLLQSDGSRIDLYDPEIDALRWSYASGDAMQVVPEWARTGGLKANQAVAGTAFAEQRPARTDDYLADERFVRDDEAAAFVRETGIRSVVAVPLAGASGPLGTLSVVSRTVGAYDDADTEVLAALGAQASIAISNAHLMTELGRSRADHQRRADAEQALREIGAEITAIRKTDDLLQRVVDEAVRLLRADGAVIDQFDAESGTLGWAYDSGIPEHQREGVKMTNLRVGEGATGKAIAERRVIVLGDYQDAEFRHDALADSLARDAGLRDLIVAPIIGDAGPLGAIEVFSLRPHAFDEIDAAVLGGLAEQAAIAITNASLIDELERSQRALARRAETERSLRDITARIAALQDPDEVLKRVVEDAKRLLASDGAHLTRMHESGTHLVPVVVAGDTDEADRAWLSSMEFPLGGGINGLAAEQGTPVWTFDYLLDPRIPREAEDIEVAERLGLRGMASAPLRAPGGEVVGTLAISASEPRVFEADELDLLQGLADQAAIALANSNLLVRLTREEARFRGLVQTTPDVIWRADDEGFFTFMADSGEPMFGWPIDEIIGKHFGLLTEPASMPTAMDAFQAAARTPDLVERVPLVLLRRDGTTFNAEVTVTGVFEDGRFVGAQGTVRDVSERERLERELRRSEERYRFLVQNAPDVIWSVDADNRLTFISDASERLTGFKAEELLGQHFGAVVHPSSSEVATVDWTQVMVDAPTQELRGRLNLRHRDGDPIPAEFIAVTSRDADGRFLGANGSVRDMRDQDRLERELRDSEGRYRGLVQTMPDMIWRCGPDGRFVFVADTSIDLFGWLPSELVGKHFSVVTHESGMADAVATWEYLTSEPDKPLRVRIPLLHRDGTVFPAEVSAVAVTEGGRFLGGQGTIRDVSARVRMERELRRQAGELAAGEERAHLARELHDSVTQALFSMTLVSRSAELLLDRDTEAAREHLHQLRELQREALAEMRALIFELRPGNLEQDGLVRALKTHTTALQGRIGLPVIVESDLDGRLPLAAEEVLYRIAQEALHNVVKHAAAHQVWIAVRRKEGGVQLRVEDDGKGFDPGAVLEGHLGLAGMRARADRLGAAFACDSAPGKGTRIEVVVSEERLAELREAASLAGNGSDAGVPAETASIRDE